MSPSTTRHPLFFPGMSVLLAAIVYYGFAPTYYRRPIDLPGIPVYLHAHGAAMTAWFTLLIVQTVLVATGRRGAHRRLGTLGAALGAAIAVLTPPVVIWFIPTLRASGAPIPIVTLIILGDLVAVAVFAVMLGAAIHYRRQPETHARLLLLASVPLVAPALGRASITATGTPLAGLLIQMSLPLLLVAHDLWMMRRVHRATGWGTLAVVGSMLSSIAVAHTGAGQAFVRALDGILPR
jgi:hypothetical protein